MARSKAADVDGDAEVVGLMALVFIAGDEARLHQFLQTTGISPGDLRAAAGDSATLLAILDYLMADQSLLLVFAAESGLAPESIIRAHTLVSGNQD